MSFTRLTKNVLNVSALPDRVQNQAQALKLTFDQAGVDIKEALNALIAEIEAITAANNIGADVGSVTTKTVQAILTAFEEAIANRYTKLEIDTLFSSGTNNLVEDVDINLTTGVITVVKKDGTVETFDTALEKVPAKFEIVESNGTYVLKITNVDGTATQTDITNLMNIYNFNSSDTIAFEVTGENEKTVTATIKANSIGLDKLSLSVVSTLEGYMNSAKDSASAAKTSETNARTSEINAANAEATAIEKAAEASTSAATATTKAAEAKKSAEDAEYWAGKAEELGSGDFVTNSVFNAEISNRYTKTETNTQINNAVSTKADFAEVNKMQGDLYTQDRYNKPTIQKIPIETGVFTDNRFFTNMVEVDDLTCRNDNVQVAVSSIGSTSHLPTLMFDGNYSTYWSCATNTQDWIKLEFCEAVKITKLKIKIDYASSYFQNMVVQGSNDDSIWDELNTSTPTRTTETEITIENQNFYKYYRINFNRSTASYLEVYELELTEVEGSFWWYSMNLSLPLTSYEKGKIVNIEGSEYIDGETTITDFENIYININNLGAKKINGTICADKQYSLAYNGESFDIISPFVSGVLSGKSFSSGDTFSIDLGTEYKYVLLQVLASSGADFVLLENGASKVQYLKYDSTSKHLKVNLVGTQLKFTATGLTSSLGEFRYLGII